MQQVVLRILARRVLPQLRSTYSHKSRLHVLPALLPYQHVNYAHTVATKSAIPEFWEAPPSRAVSAFQSGSSVCVQWNNGRLSQYPNVWLRDSCRCQQCFHAGSNNRMISMVSLDLDVKPKDIKIGGDLMTITWQDGHESTFESKWLLEREFSLEAKEKRMHQYRSYPILWGCEMKDRIPKFDFNAVLESDKSLFDWLITFDTFGMTLLENVPKETGQLKKLIGRVGFPHINHYGEYQHVIAKDVAFNAATTNKTLEFHTDLAQVSDIPGTQYFHCIKQAEGHGGENVLVDGFNVANQLRTTDAEAFRTLTTTYVDYRDIAESEFVGKFHTMNRAKVIHLNELGQVDGINFHTRMRSYSLNVGLHEVIPLYRALKTFITTCYDPQHAVKIKLKEGEILSFDNRRVLHGREGYTRMPGAERHLEVVYCSWDYLRSRLRVLKRDLF